MSTTTGAASLYGAASLRREGDYWAIEFDGRMCRLKHAKGVSFLAALLAHPGRRIAALELDRLLAGGMPGEEGGADPATSEKARLNVTRALRLTIKKIAAYHPTAGGHLAGAIRTGRFCSYTPDPRLSIEWSVSSEAAPAVVPARRSVSPVVPLEPPERG